MFEPKMPISRFITTYLTLCISLFVTAACTSSGESEKAIPEVTDVDYSHLKIEGDPAGLPEASRELFTLIRYGRSVPFVTVTSEMIRLHHEAYYAQQEEKKDLSSTSTVVGDLGQSTHTLADLKV